MNYLGRTVYVNETAKIVAYNSVNLSGLQQLRVHGSPNSLWNHWDIHHDRGNIPASHTVHNTTAFFVVPTCPANLHHFWVDEFVPLYSVVSRVNRLHQGANNQILYRSPSELAVSYLLDGCTSTAAYQDILRTLFINPFHDVFYRAPVNECYSSAVFGTHAAVSDLRTIISHVTLTLLGKETINQIASSKLYVTFVQRRYRRIINIHELVQAAQSVGFPQVRIVNFEGHSVKEQVNLTTMTQF